MEKTDIKTVVIIYQKPLQSFVQKFLWSSFSLLSILILLTMTQHAHAEGSGIVKWKDDKGVTHYGDKIPAQYSNTENSIMNKQGITVKRNKPVSVQDEAVSNAKIKQDKKDKALLSAFTDESEIDLARDRNLQLDQVTVEGLQLQRANSQKRLTDNQKYVNTFTVKKKPVPVDVAADFKKSQEEVAKIDIQIADRKTAMDATRKRFEEDKKRYIALKNYANGNGPAPGPPEVIVPTPSIASAPNTVPVPTTAPATTNQPPAVPANIKSSTNAPSTSKSK